MRKTDLILQHLAGCGDKPDSAANIADAINDETKNVSALLTYLRSKQRVCPSSDGWTITRAGRKYIEEVIQEAREDAAVAPPRVISAPLRKAEAKKPAHVNGNKPAALRDALPPIERGIPITGKARPGAYRELAEQMQVGDSVLFETDTKASCLRMALRKMNCQSAQRATKEGVRIWRTT